MDGDGRTLTIGQVAERTGVAAPTLRAWEARHGFPSPGRGPGGQRRYDERDVGRIAAVLQARGAGMSLGAAIRSATADTPESRTPSMFARVTELFPELRPFRLTKSELHALTRAVEDEHCALGGRGLLVGSFQEAHFYRQSELRWRALSRSTDLALVLADFDAPRLSGGRPVEIPVAGESPLAREWAVVYHAPNGSGCLSGWEIPQPAPLPDRDRRFEVLWSPDPEVAAAACTLAGELLEGFSADLGERLREGAALRGGRANARAVVSQANRMLAYLTERPRAAAPLAAA